MFAKTRHSNVLFYAKLTMILLKTTFPLIQLKVYHKFYTRLSYIVILLSSFNIKIEVRRGFIQILKIKFKVRMKI